MPADSVLLPFFLGTAQYAVRKRRRPSARCQPNSEPTTNACQGARAKVCPAHSPLECRRKPKKSIACRAACTSKRSPLDAPRAEILEMPLAGQAHQTVGEHLAPGHTSA